jgi:hypothetical protein
VVVADCPPRKVLLLAEHTVSQRGHCAVHEAAEYLPGCSSSGLGIVLLLLTGRRGARLAAATATTGGSAV